MGVYNFGISSNVGSSTVITASRLSKLYSIYELLRRERNAISIVSTNPDFKGQGKAKQYRFPGSNSSVYNETSNIKAGKIQQPSNINTLGNALPNVGGSKVTISSGSTISASTLNSLLSGLRSGKAYSDKYASYWDSSNYCARSCQVKCQATCQLACQGCNNNNCHDQNCGGWS